jgi:hypothetical protein
MDKKMKQRVLQIMELLLTRQKEAAALQERVNAELKADIIANIEARHERFLTIPDGCTSHGKGTTTCQTETMFCPEEMKDTIRTEATPEETEAAVECQDLFKEELNMDNIASSQDRYGEQGLIVRRRRGAKKRSQDSIGSRQKLCRPQASHTSRRPCRSKRKNS